MTNPPTAAPATKTLFCTLATAGHVDHGKTSVLRNLTGIDPDRLKEEKQRQMTTDLGFAHLTAGTNADGSELVIGFIDVPGHGKFLKNMLAGVDGIDMALLIVAADEGPMPQTENHVKILSLLGVSRAIVVLTKIDIADDAQQALARSNTERLLHDFQIDIVDIVPVSATKKIGFEKLKSTLAAAARRITQSRSQSDSEPVYLPIDRVFTKAGFGLVVTGTLVRGKIAPGDSILIEPGGGRGRVRNLETFGRHLSQASAGQRLAVNVALKEEVDLHRGLTILGAPLVVSSALIVRLTDIQPSIKNVDRLEKRLLELKGQRVRIYHGTAECSGMVRWTQSFASAVAGEAGDATAAGAADGAAAGAAAGATAGAAVEITAGAAAGAVIAQLALDEPTLAEPGHRFILRYGDEGLCGGEILMTGRPRWLSRKKMNEVLPSLLSKNLEEATVAFVHSTPFHVAKTDQLKTFLTRQSVDAVLTALIEKGKLLSRSNHLMSIADDLELKNKIVKAVSAAAQSATKSIIHGATASLESIRSANAHGIDKSVFQALVRELCEAGVLHRDGDRVGPTEGASHSQSAATSLKSASTVTASANAAGADTVPGAAEPAKSATNFTNSTNSRGAPSAASGKSATSAAPSPKNQIMEKITQILAEEFCLEISEIAKRTGVDEKTVLTTVHAMSRLSLAKVVNYEFASSTASLERAHQALQDVWTRKHDISPSEFREALGISRKYVMALLAYFDDNSITRRSGNARILLKQVPRQL